MPKKHEHVIDPTLPYSTFVYRGRELKLCMNLGAIAKAEHHLKEQGNRVILLFAKGDRRD